ncbi:ATP-binding protein [Lysobacter sp. KIS68-7]|uniref:sensor histidine kinase n=1 Tax=Lysobacter sp. KIS68-7 TaxID=2904252 RepID=UPI001E296595|nr:ATP-binding protein [Lysobacter sp. KIS68-7]UHQ20085.1 ATP-binding protein [Lysobacter sp. KIS68-7]
MQDLAVDAGSGVVHPARNSVKALLTAPVRAPVVCIFLAIATLAVLGYEAVSTPTGEFEQRWTWLVIAVLAGAFVWMAWLLRERSRALEQAQRSLAVTAGSASVLRGMVREASADRETTEDLHAQLDAERRRHERESAMQRDELAHLSRVAMLGELSGALAHELNQPLSAILSNAQAAQRLLRLDPPELTEIGDILADIVIDDRRAGEVIQRLRTWLRKEHVEHVPLAVNDIVLDTLHLVRSDLLHRGIDVQLELAGDLPRVAGDRIQLQQVLLNLVLNSCDAMDTVPLPRVLRVSTSETGGGARVDVVDRGAGIASTILATMFNPFESTKSSGLGMGLAVCRTIVDSHGGRIWADNLPGGGARVSFELPEMPR